MSKYDHKYIDHMQICEDLNKMYIFKNERYDDAFAKGIEEWGLTSVGMRLGDKFNRFKEMIKNPDIDPGDESIEDTLMDMANYCIMTLVELGQKALDEAIEAPLPEGTTYYEDCDKVHEVERVKTYEMLVDKDAPKTCERCIYSKPNDPIVPWHPVCERCYDFNQFEPRK